MYRAFIAVLAIFSLLCVSDLYGQGKGKGRGGGPSMSIRGPSSSMRLPSSIVRSPSLSMRSPAYSSRYPSYMPRGPYPNFYGRSIYPSSYPYVTFGLSLRSYPYYIDGYPYASRVYPYSSYRSSLRYTLPYGYGSSSVVVVPSADVYPYRASPPVAASAIVPFAEPVPSGGSGPARLLRSLSTRQGEPWLEYLMPDRVIEAIETNDVATLRELAQRYDGVVNNPELRWVANLNGFAATRNLIHQHVGNPASEKPQPAPIPDPQVNQPEPLPTPAAAIESTDEI